MSDSIAVKIASNDKTWSKYRGLFEMCAESFLNFPERLVCSFLPSINRHRLYGDLLGPTISLIILVTLLQYGFHRKTVKPTGNGTDAACYVAVYFAAVSTGVYALSKVVYTNLKLTHIMTLLGYSFYGYILALGLPFFLRSSDSVENDYIFFAALIAVGCTSGLRILFVLLFAIEVPVARLLVCSLLGNVHILFLIYLNYNFMHPTFVFGLCKS